MIFATRQRDRGETVAQEVRQQGGEARFVQADDSHIEDVERLIAEALTADFTPEQFDRTLTMNLKSIAPMAGFILRDRHSMIVDGGMTSATR